MKQKLLNLVITEFIICLFTLPLVLWALLDVEVDKYGAVFLIVVEATLITTQGFASWSKTSKEQCGAGEGI